MAEGDAWRLVPGPIRDLPADLVAVAGLVLLTDVAIFAPVLSESSIRIVLGLPLVLFLPGYALTAALFPEAYREPSEDTDNATNDSMGMSGEAGIDGIERLALSVGLSIAVVPLIGVGLNFTPSGIRLVPIVVSVTAFTLGVVAVAASRRRALQPSERFRVPFREWMAAARQSLFAPESWTDAVINVLLVLSVLVATASVTYVVAVPQPGGPFTEFYLLTEDDDGELVAADYPTELRPGQPRSIVVGIGNHERRSVTYSVIIKLQRVNFIGDNETNVVEETRLDEFTVKLDHNQTEHRTVLLEPSMEGTQLRLAFLLYDGNPPGDPTVENAYRETHLWVNVTETG